MDLTIGTNCDFPCKKLSRGASTPTSDNCTDRLLAPTPKNWHEQHRGVVQLTGQLIKPAPLG
eukprot:357023-Chlamydomonas_euryale.AAC.3